MSDQRPEPMSLDEARKILDSIAARETLDCEACATCERCVSVPLDAEDYGEWREKGYLPDTVRAGWVKPCAEHQPTARHAWVRDVPAEAYRDFVESKRKAPTFAYRVLRIEDLRQFLPAAVVAP